MLDIQQLRTNLDAVAARLADRGYVFDRETFLALEAERKDSQGRAQELQAARNAHAKKIGQAKAKGEDAAALMAGTDDPEVKQTLLDNTTKAFEAGAFGSPSFLVDGELYFGKDRLRDVEEAIAAA